MLCSMRVRICSTSAIPSSLKSNSAGVRFPISANGVCNQCVALCSLPNTPIACPITGTARTTVLVGLIFELYCQTDRDVPHHTTSHQHRFPVTGLSLLITFARQHY